MLDYTHKQGIYSPSKRTDLKRRNDNVFQPFFSGNAFHYHLALMKISQSQRPSKIHHPTLSIDQSTINNIEFTTRSNEFWWTLEVLQLEIAMLSFFRIFFLDPVAMAIPNPIQSPPVMMQSRGHQKGLPQREKEIFLMEKNPALLGIVESKYSIYLNSGDW